MSHIISIQNLSKVFNKKQVLKNISLTMPHNGIFGVIGLNGTGKTTLIKCLLNLIPDYTGSITINNNENRHSDTRKIIAYVPERFSPNINVTGYEYITTYANIYKTPIDIEKIHDLATSISLDQSFLKLKIKECSKGTVQKIGILAAFYVNAKVIILDEPTSGLDILARKSLKNMFLKYASDKLIIFSSHILSDVQELSNNIAIIVDGEVRYTGTSQNFMELSNSLNIEDAFIKSYYSK
jgi:ABC-type multidrug transport system ATPase subunit